MEQSSSWEANWSAASQEIPRILWNPKVHHCNHKRTPLSLSWASSIQSTHSHPTSRRSSLILSSHLCLGLPSGSFPQVSTPKPCTHLSPPPYALHAPLISFYHSHNIGWGVQIIQLLTVLAFSAYNFHLMRSWMQLVQFFIFSFFM